MAEKKIKEEELIEQDKLIDEDTDYGEDESWKHVKVYDPSVAKERAYKETKINRIYRRDEKGQIHITYEKKKSRYQEGMY